MEDALAAAERRPTMARSFQLRVRGFAQIEPRRGRLNHCVVNSHPGAYGIRPSRWDLTPLIP